MSLDYVTCGWWWMYYSTPDWMINCSSSCQLLVLSKAHIKCPRIFPHVSYPPTDCNHLCGLEAKLKREAVISKQHNMREMIRVATGSAVPAVLRESDGIALLV